MRSAIRQKLNDEIPEIGGRVLDPQLAATTTVKPFLVLRQGEEALDRAWTGFKRFIEVWPYNEQQSDYQSLDELAGKVVAALDRQQMTTSGGDKFTCRYAGTISGGDTCRYAGTVNGDYVDAQLQAITRGLQFFIPAVQPLTPAEATANDPWLEALALWTGELLGAGWSVYRNILPTGYNCPSVLWRMAGVEVREKSGSLFEVRKKMAGHVLGSTNNQELEGALVLARELGKAVRIAIGQGEAGYCAVSAPAADYMLDPFSAGQLTVVLSGLTEKTAAAGPLMAAVHNAGLIE